MSPCNWFTALPYNYVQFSILDTEQQQPTRNTTYVQEQLVLHDFIDYIATVIYILNNTKYQYSNVSVPLC